MVEADIVDCVEEAVRDIVSDALDPSDASRRCQTHRDESGLSRQRVTAVVALMSPIRTDVGGDPPPRYFVTILSNSGADLFDFDHPKDIALYGLYDGNGPGLFWN